MQLTQTTPALLADFLVNRDLASQQLLNSRCDFNTYDLFRLVAQDHTTITTKNYMLFLCRHGRYFSDLPNMSVSYKDFCTLIKLKVPTNSPRKLLNIQPLPPINSEPSLLELLFVRQPNFTFQLGELVRLWRILESEQTKLILEHA